MAALRERIAAAKAFVAKQSSSAVSVEKEARRTRLLTGIPLGMLGIVLIGGFWWAEHRRATAEEGLGWFYLLFSLPLVMGVVLILQSRYSEFRNGSLDAEDS